MDPKAFSDGRGVLHSGSEKCRFVVSSSLLPEKRMGSDPTDAELQQKRQKQEGQTSADAISSPKALDSGGMDFPLTEPPPPPAPTKITMSKVDKASTIHLSECLTKVTSSKGYRTARATHGVSEGCWYFEVIVEHLGESGHCRLGWATKQAHLYAPVGFDQYGYSYRDIEGTKQHMAERASYGSPFGSGDVIGCLIYIPKKEEEEEEENKNDDSRTEVGKNDVQSEELQKSKEQQQQKNAQTLPGSSIHFYKNGVWQGVAFRYSSYLIAMCACLFALFSRDLHRGVYFPAVSMFTRPEQLEGVTLEVEFGKRFAFQQL